MISPSILLSFTSNESWFKSILYLKMTNDFYELGNKVVQFFKTVKINLWVPGMAVKISEHLQFLADFIVV